MRTNACLMLGASAIAIAGCTNLPGASLGATFGAERYLKSEHGGPDFNGSLAREYTQVARHMAYTDARWMNATAFIAKARLAEAGITPAPWMPSELGVNGDAMAMYGDVVARINANREAHPAACGRAQALWDQYLAILRGEANGARCKLSAAEARAMLDEALASCAPGGPSTSNFVVYFGFDKTNLTEVALETIDALVAAVQSEGTTALSVVGHADTVGSVQYNQGLSERRANRVADTLTDRGVPAGAMTLAGRSELEPAVPTAENVKEPLNRRVEITLSK